MLGLFIMMVWLKGGSFELSFLFVSLGRRLLSSFYSLVVINIDDDLIKLLL